MSPLAAREALAGRVPLPGLRPRQGLGAGPGAADAPVRGLRAAGLGHRRHRAPRQPPAAAHLVPGRVADGDPRERHLGPAAMEAARAGQLQVGLAPGPQAAPGDGRPGAGAARRPGGGRRAPGRWGEREVSLRTGAVLVGWRSVAWRTPVAQADRPFLLDHFSALEDPRQRAKVLYPLPEILLLLLCATLAGADDCRRDRALGRRAPRLFSVASCRASTGCRATTRWAR